MITVVVSINDRRGGGEGARRKQFDPAALMQVLMIADISRGLGGGFRNNIVASGRRIVPSFY